MKLSANPSQILFKLGWANLCASVEISGSKLLIYALSPIEFDSVCLPASCFSQNCLLLSEIDGNYGDGMRVPNPIPHLSRLYSIAASRHCISDQGVHRMKNNRGVPRSAPKVDRVESAPPQGVGSAYFRVLLSVFNLAPTTTTPLRLRSSSLLKANQVRFKVTMFI